MSNKDLNPIIINHKLGKIKPKKIGKKQIMKHKKELILLVLRELIGLLSEIIS